MMRALGIMALLSQLSCLGDLTSVRAEGRLKDGSDFGTSFFPNGTSFAMFNRFVTHNDNTVAERGEGLVTLFISTTQFDPTIDLQSLSAAEQEDLVQQVRTQDLIVVNELSASILRTKSVLKTTQPPTKNNFNFVIRHATQLIVMTQTTPAPLNNRITLQLSPTLIELKDYGRLVVEPNELGLERGENQTERTSEGNVTLHINVPILPERLAESNLQLLSRA